MKVIGEQRIKLTKFWSFRHFDVNILLQMVKIILHLYFKLYENPSDKKCNCICIALRAYVFSNEYSC
jgi:hypothetical protein